MESRKTEENSEGVKMSRKRKCVRQAVIEISDSESDHDEQQQQQQAKCFTVESEDDDDDDSKIVILSDTSELSSKPEENGKS